MVPGSGRPRVVSAWALGRGPNEVKKKQKIIVRLKVFLNMMNFPLIFKRKRYFERITYIEGLSN